MKLIRTPKSLALSVTNKCNLRCAYCSHFDSEADTGQDCSTKEWLTFFEELNRCAVMEVVIEGGEPLLRPDLKELLQGIIDNRMRFSILTNGTLITDEMAAFLAATPRCNYVQVSIDGSWSGPHDKFRNDGSFDKAIAGLKTLQRHGVPVTVRVTIHRHNVDDLEAIAQYLLEERRIPGISTNAASFEGSCRSQAEQIQLTAEERSRAMQTLVRLKEKYPGRITATAGPLAEAEQWLHMEQARREQQPQIQDCGYLRSCGGFHSKMAVRADGIFVPCILMSHIELGRMNHDSLTEVWQHHPELARLRERRSIPLESFDFCKECDYIPYCRGNCPALAYTLTGIDNHPSPDACLKRFLEAGGTLPDMNATPVNEHER